MNQELALQDISALPQPSLETMLEAGHEILESYRVLKKAGLNVVGECMKNQGDFIELTHYPNGDVYDSESHSQYYYHAHRGIDDEHGHFHTFLRQPGMRADMQPVSHEGEVEWPSGEDAVSHIIAISMDRFGYPIGLFAVNRWVTGETWYPAARVKQMVGLFEIDHAWPNLPVNQWISAMFRLFQPEINALLDHRDVTFEKWQQERRNIDAFEDRELEVTGFTRISVENRLAEILALLGPVDQE